MFDLPLHLISSVIGDVREAINPSSGGGNSSKSNSPSRRGKENARRFSLRPPYATIVPQRMKSASTLLAIPQNAIMTETSATGELDSSILACGVCMEMFSSLGKDRKPRVLPYCGHTLCESCLRRSLASASSGTILCHVCRRANPLVSHKCVEDFPVSWTIIDVLDQIGKRAAAKEEAKDSGEKCSLCHKHETSHWCRSHCAKFCAYCAFKHLKECEGKQKLIEVCEVPGFARQTLESGKEFLTRVRKRAEEARASRDRIGSEVEANLQRVILALNKAKAEEMAKIDAHVLQLEMLAGEIDGAIQASGISGGGADVKFPAEEHLQKAFIRSLSRLEDILGRQAAAFDSSFKLDFKFYSAVYDQVLAGASKIFHAETSSPYSACDTAELYQSLMSACERGDLRVVDFLLGSNTPRLEVNHRERGGSTALISAVSGGRGSVCRLLCEKYSADVNIQDGAGKTALIHSCLSGLEEMAAYLVKRCKANPNLQTKWKDTALHCVAEAGNMVLVRLLVEEAAADLGVKNSRGRTAEEIAKNEHIRLYLAAAAEAGTKGSH